MRCNATAKKSGGNPKWHSKKPNEMNVRTIVWYVLYVISIYIYNKIGKANISYILCASALNGSYGGGIV